MCALRLRVSPRNGRLRVLFVVFEFGDRVAGGLGRVVNGVSQPLSELCQLHVLVLYRHPLWLTQCQLYEAQSEGARPLGPGQLDSRRNFERLVAAVGGYDVVHFFYANEAIMTSKLDILRARWPATKVVFSVHNLFKHERYTRPCRKTFLRAEAQMMRRVDHVHVLNETGRRLVLECYPTVAQRMNPTVIYNGLDPKTFQRRDWLFERSLRVRTQGAKQMVVCLSRWAPGKGLEVLTDAFVHVQRSHPDAVLVLAGRKSRSWEVGSARYVQQVDKRLSLLGTRGLGLGWLDESQRNSLFALSDVAVMPSLLEYFPYASTEPLHQSVPLVQSRLECLEELVDDREHCRFFQPGSVEQCADALLQALADPAASVAMGERGGRHIRRLMRWPSIASQYCQMYEHLVAGAQRPEASV